MLNCREVSYSVATQLRSNRSQRSLILGRGSHAGGKIKSNEGCDAGVARLGVGCWIESNRIEKRSGRRRITDVNCPLEDSKVDRDHWSPLDWYRSTYRGGSSHRGDSTTQVVTGLKIHGTFTKEATIGRDAR